MRPLKVECSSASEVTNKKLSIKFIAITSDAVFFVLLREIKLNVCSLIKEPENGAKFSFVLNDLR